MLDLGSAVISSDDQLVKTVLGVLNTGIELLDIDVPNLADKLFDR